MSKSPETIINLANQFSHNETEIKTLFSALNGWDAKFRQLMLLGKDLPQLTSNYQQEEYLVSGCESRVWLIHTWHNDQLKLAATSDAKIIKGLITVIFSVFNNKTKQQIGEFDLDNYFDQLNLLNQLSPSRANGVYAIVNTIKSFCE